MGKRVFLEGADPALRRSENNSRNSGFEMHLEKLVQFNNLHFATGLFGGG